MFLLPVTTSTMTGRTTELVTIVEKVVDGVITVIEGNYSNSVKQRTLEVNGKYIRGYGVPKYDPEEAAKTKPDKQSPVTIHDSVRLPRLEKGSEGPSVKRMQALLLDHGEKLPKYGADGEFGNETGDALESFQSKHNLKKDRKCGLETWAALITT